MSQINLNTYYSEAMKVVDTLQAEQSENIKAAAAIFAESIANDGVIHIFGSGHSVAFAAELTGRAGSLVPFHMIATSDFVTKGLTTREDFEDRTNIFERRPNTTGKLYDIYDIKPQDVFIVISNSGINGLVIDLAIKAKEKGHKVVVITSMQHTLAEPSRHPSGKKLYELADIAIDNCGPQGDALLAIDGKIEKICSFSSIGGGFIAQAFTVEITRILNEMGKDIPLLKLERDDAAKTYNHELLNKYKGRI